MRSYLTCDHRVVYQIITRHNGKFVIGSTRNTKERFPRHLRALRRNIHWNHKLQRAFNKYGEGDIWIGVLEIVPDGVDPFDREQVWIDAFWDSGCLLNESREVLRFPTFHQLTPEKQKRIRDSLRVSFHNRPPEEQVRLRAAYANGKLGDDNPSKREEVRRRIAESVSGSKNFWFGKKRPEYAKKMTGRKHSPETLLKMRAKRQAWWKRNGEQMVGRRKHSPETLLKMRQARQAWWAERKKQTA